MESSEQHKHLNPIGRLQLFDVVLRSQSEKRPGHVIVRNRGAVMMFSELKGGWKTMEGYTCFWKGVKLFHKPKDFRERLAPGMRRTIGYVQHQAEDVAIPFDGVEVDFPIFSENWADFPLSE